jgi:hypothetical protein
MELAEAVQILGRRDSCSLAKKRLTMSEELFGLKEAIAKYEAQHGYIHKLWAYFQFILFGAIGIVWSWSKQLAAAYWFFLVGYVVFSFAHGYLLFRAQKQLVLITAAIETLWNKNIDKIPEELRGLSNTFNIFPIWYVPVVHVAFDLLPVTAIIFRLCS